MENVVSNGDALETKVPSRFRGMLQAILFPRWDIPGADVTQLMTAWEKQVHDCEQLSGDIISDAIKLRVGAMVNIYTWLQVKVGRETEVKRRLEFELNEGVSEELAVA